MKRAFLIRGFRFGYSAADPDWSPLCELVKELGYQPVPVPWTWNYKTASEYTNQFVTFYQQHKAKENIVIGHSFGAVVAFLAATRLKPDMTLLCSLSGYFKEDLPKYSNSDWIIKHMGMRRRKDFENLSAVKTVRKIRKLGLKVAMIYGEKENQTYPHLYARNFETAKELKPWKFIEIPSTDHTIFDLAYLNAIRSTVSDYESICKFKNGSK